MLALGTFLMLMTEFVVAGLLPEIAADLQVSVARAGLLITVFAVGMIVGAPLMAMLTLRLPHAVDAGARPGRVRGRACHRRRSAPSFALLLGARFLTALATGAFWAVANVVAARAAGPLRAPARWASWAPEACSPPCSACRSALSPGSSSGWRGPFWALAVLALAAVRLIARHVPHDGPDQQAVSIRSELTALRSGRLWLALAACATTTGGVLSAYSYISPLLTDRAGIAAGLVPLVLVGFGVGALVGLDRRRAARRRPPARDDHRGRRGDHGPTAGDLPALRLRRCPRPSLVVLLGLFGLGANPVLISLAVRFAGQAPTLGSALSVSAFNVGTAVGSWVAGLALDSSLGAAGPAVVGTVIAALTLVPTIAIAVIQRRRVITRVVSSFQSTTGACTAAG